MQDAIYKPHQINDEVFLIVYCQEQPFRPILFKCLVSSYNQKPKTTIYNLQPLIIITDIPDTVTLRCLSGGKVKDITFVYDNQNKFNWVQQFTNKELLIESQQQSIFEDLSEAIKMINKLNNSMIMRLNNEIIAMMEQNNKLNL